LLWNPGYCFIWRNLLVDANIGERQTGECPELSCAGKWKGKRMKWALTMAVVNLAAVCQLDAAILDFTGLGPNNSPIPQTYGDGATWDVTYLTRNGSFGNSAVLDPDLYYWSTGYSGTQDVAWAQSVAEVFIDPQPGFFVTLNSFDLTPWQGGPYTAEYRIYDSNFNLLSSGGPQVLTALQNYPINVSNPDGIRIQFRQSNFIAIDNISFDVAATPPVPEPSSLALFAAGLSSLLIYMRRWNGPRATGLDFRPLPSRVEVQTEFIRMRAEPDGIDLVLALVGNPGVDYVAREDVVAQKEIAVLF
jgi:hypothetical protein